MPAGSGQTITVRCKCGSKLKAPASAVGRKAKCPKCSAVVMVELPPPKPPADELDDALFDLAADAKSAALYPPPVTRSVCPNCQQALAASAVLCTACGYDTRTGKSLAAAKGSASASPSPAMAGAFPTLQTKVEMQKPAPTGTMLKGAIISAVFAFVGALVWFGIAKATHREIGWIAWGVGIAAGFGMMIGYNGTSVAAGAVSAGMAVGGILVGKWMVFALVVMPIFMKIMGKTLDAAPDEVQLKVAITNQQLEQKKIDPEIATDSQRRTAADEADKLMARMDAKTRAAEVAKAKVSVQAIGNRLLGQVDRTSLFFKTMFDPMDLVFMVIAIASAFKVATFGGEVESS